MIIDIEDHSSIYSTFKHYLTFCPKTGILIHEITKHSHFYNIFMKLFNDNKLRINYSLQFISIFCTPYNDESSLKINTYTDLRYNFWPL